MHTVQLHKTITFFCEDAPLWDHNVIVLVTMKDK